MNNIFKLGTTHSYVDVVNTLLAAPDRVSSNRKGEKLYEGFNMSLEITNASQAYFWQRNASLSYLEKELEFYLSGSRDLEDAVKCSKFWDKCSDDGRTINSNYGAMLFHDYNRSGNTQFGYALEALKNNLSSKKAVMVLHDTAHGYVSNDNPCTMFVHFYTTEHEQESEGMVTAEWSALHMRVVMRSNDIWFGTTYDMPFFAVVWEVMRRRLQDHYSRPIKLGTYTHQALNLHMYERNVQKWRNCKDLTEEQYAGKKNQYSEILHRYVEKFYALSKVSMKHHVDCMEHAWQASQESKCLKKQCGCVIVHPEYDIVGFGYGGRAHGDVCSTCARDAGEVFHGDGCWSVHAEMRALRQAVQKAHALHIGAAQTELFLNECTAYVTHGPCDACLKLLDFYGITKVFYDKPYKTNYGHWPRMTILRLQMPE